MNWFETHRHEYAGELYFNEPMNRHTYYRIGGPAQVMAVPRSLEDLRWLARGILVSEIPFFVMGAGSNLLVADSGYSGLIIRTHKLNLEITLIDDNKANYRLRTGASVAIPTLLRRAQADGWGGLEFLCGIPGLVGGAVSMNAGTWSGEVKDRVIEVTAFDFEKAGAGTGGEIAHYSKDQLHFEYRKNLFIPKNQIIWSADWNVEPESPSLIRKKIEELLERRKNTQPVNFPSCGSVFKNPKSSGLNAWQVINELGLRGQRIGNAQFSIKHSNFIVNLGDAKAADVMALIRLAQTRAEKELGIYLETEVQILGAMD